MDEHDHFEERLARINRYINENYTQPISSGELAEKLFLSRGYLARFFKKNYGMSFAEYLSGVRLYHAVEDLTYTSLPITRIAYDNGFSNVASFDKAFKDKYGDVPSALRRKLQNSISQEEDDPAGDAAKRRLENYLRTDGFTVENEEEHTVKTDTIPVRKSEEIRNCWQDTINIGSASDLLKSDVREHVLDLKELLNIRYVRFWNIFSGDMLIAPAIDEENYNFTRLDMIIDFLLDNGLYPHIELGMKPRRLMRTMQEAVIVEENDNSELKQKMEQFVRVLMRHLNNRYRRRQLDHWRLELWFDEELRNVPGEEERYFDQFGRIYRIVRNYSEGMLVGGGGLRGRYENPIDTEVLLQMWMQHEVHPDFISGTLFSYERGSINHDHYSKRSTDNDFLLHELEYFRGAMQKAGMEDIPFFLTEWNLTKSDRNFINDSCFKGAYIVKNLLDTYGLADMISYFVGSDRVLEHYDSNGTAFGGSGLLTGNGLIKPAGYAFRFMNWLYGYFLGKGKNYLITTDRYDDYAVVFHNQKPLSYNYYLSKEDEIEKENIWKYFDDSNALKLELQLTDVADGMYQVKTYRINEQSGSILRKWGELGYEKELSVNDVKYMRRVCGPVLSIQMIEAKDGVLPLEVTIAANEFGFIRARKYE
ncbi:MAG: helix-turn-helix domain-containing protein [Blautia sp.]|nr:helix-turn-helix domain-containing protein [Blautia sp.]